MNKKSFKYVNLRLNMENPRHEKVGRLMDQYDPVQYANRTDWIVSCLMEHLEEKPVTTYLNEILQELQALRGEMERIKGTDRQEEGKACQEEDPQKEESQEEKGICWEEAIQEFLQKRR